MWKCGVDARTGATRPLKNGDSGVAQMSRSSLFAVTWEAGGGDELGEAGNCIAGVNFGKAACARLNSYGPHAVRSLQYGKIEHRFQY